ncbi:MAG: IPT/TIG domain-containing protein, partial [Planctomycetota bacterium]
HASVDTANNRVTGFITGFCCTGSIGRGSKPLAPPDFSVDVNEDNSVTISWTTEETVVIVERTDRIDGLRPVHDGDFTLTIHLNAALLSWRDTVPASTPGFYWYRLRALRSSTQSAVSRAERIATFASIQPPPAPAPLNATAIPCGGISLDWPSVQEAESYRIERKLAFEPSYTRIATRLFYETSYVDTTGLSPGGDYEYRVYAINNAGLSTFSYVRVTNSESEYTVAVAQSDHWLRIPPGGSAEIDVDIIGHAGPVDVELTASIDTSRVTAEFDPSTTDDQSVLTLTVDPAAPHDLRVVVEILTEPVGSGAPCAIPALHVTVGDPLPPPGPTLESLSPVAVPANTPWTVTLTGTGFHEGAAVHVDGSPIAEWTVRSGTEIEALIPPLAPGQHPVKVVNPDGAELNVRELFAD